jgi:cytochrome c peroxidase
MLRLVALIGGLLLLYAHSNSAKAAVPMGKVVQIPAPLGLPLVPIPADNPPTEETIALGRQLYYDTALSADNTVSCSTCPAWNLLGVSACRMVWVARQEHAMRRP